MSHTEVSHIPQLATVTTGPLQLIEKQVLNKQNEIEDWFSKQWQKTPAPIYGSVDLRNAGFKLAPVDMNLFPGGFNNLQLNADFVKSSIIAFKKIVNQQAPNAKKILVIPESHTRNTFYWENVSTLLKIVKEAGFDVRIGSLSQDIDKPTEQNVRDNEIISIEPLMRSNNKIYVGDFTPDFVLLNNDLSDGIPEILHGIEQPIVPPAELGWSQRLKSEHFFHYENITKEFADIIQIDPWLINPLFRQCGEIDFMRREGEECLASHVDYLLTMIKQKYEEYGITQQPYIVIKADSGTYGMAIMMVKSIDEVLSLNRKQRTHMSKSKGGQPVKSVIVQEGVYTFEKWGDAVAEPVVYMLGEKVVGGFYRVHKERDIDENLNAPGMHFEPLVFSKSCEPGKQGECRFYAYGVVARLSMLAAAREIAEHKDRT